MQRAIQRASQPQQVCAWRRVLRPQHCPQDASPPPFSAQRQAVCERHWHSCTSVSAPRAGPSSCRRRTSCLNPK
eukprot:1963400-Pyramimonas_sp.AAC.1